MKVLFGEFGEDAALLRVGKHDFLRQARARPVRVSTKRKCRRMCIKRPPRALHIMEARSAADMLRSPSPPPRNAYWRMKMNSPRATSFFLYPTLGLIAVALSACSTTDTDSSDVASDESAYSTGCDWRGPFGENSKSIGCWCRGSVLAYCTGAYANGQFYDPTAIASCKQRAEASCASGSSPKQNDERSQGAPNGAKRGTITCGQETYVRYNRWGWPSHYETLSHYVCHCSNGGGEVQGPAGGPC